jgi:hypothetical protein
MSNGDFAYLGALIALARGFAKDNIMKTTEEALDRIVQTVE